jgi:hypothetical protein
MSASRVWNVTAVVVRVVADAAAALALAEEEEEKEAGAADPRLRSSGDEDPAAFVDCVRDFQIASACSLFGEDAKTGAIAGYLESARQSLEDLRAGARDGMMSQYDHSPAAQAARVAVVAFEAAEGASYAAFCADCDAKAAARMAVADACPTCGQSRCRKLRCEGLRSSGLVLPGVRAVANSPAAGC